METLLRRLLGLYFLITSFGYIPAALSYLGVANAVGPWWVLPLVPLAEAAIFAVAGVMLLRTRFADAVPLGAGVVFPPIDSLLQLVGIYFMVNGLGTAVEQTVNMSLFGETWFARMGNFAAALVWVAAGLFLVRRPQTILDLLTRYRAA